MLELAKCEKPDHAEEAKQTYMQLNEHESKHEDKTLELIKLFDRKTSRNEARIENRKSMGAPEISKLIPIKPTLPIV